MADPQEPLQAHRRASFTLDQRTMYPRFPVRHGM
jgi:hypothetical protein